ncbi:MAG: tRNA pseudouridine(55) synthase TruB [Deltaproteobacteria bacterium]|jgi:tRNA pseudouridine55 synthase|nr:tRNA pseudouridine(55) synthase TruB [Deltaproteobacteria bacterium]
MTNLNGAIIIDKEAGMTSAEVIGALNRKYRLKSNKIRVGHAGTLDPLATGVLLILIGKATRLQDLVMGQSKEYCGIIRLGLVTDTDDITGKVIKARAEFNCEDQAVVVSELVQKFSGKLMQRPPIYSALKVAGKRAYNLARKNQAVDLKPREIEILKSKFKFINNQQLQYNITCSKGTYIRALARDVGEFLGCGATLETIQRSKSGSFEITDAQKLNELALELRDNKSWLEFDALVKDLPCLKLSEDMICDLYYGKQEVLQQFKTEVSSVVNLSNIANGKSVGIAENIDQVLKLRFML